MNLTKIGIALTTLVFLALLVACVFAYIGEAQWIAHHSL